MHDHQWRGRTRLLRRPHPRPPTYCVRSVGTVIVTGSNAIPQFGHHPGPICRFPSAWDTFRYADPQRVCRPSVARPRRPNMIRADRIQRDRDETFREIRRCKSNRCDHRIGTNPSLAWRPPSFHILDRSPRFASAKRRIFVPSRRLCD